MLSASDINVLADLPSRDTLLAQFAGALAAPLQQLAGLIQALPRNLAYGLSALIDQRQAAGEVLAEPAPARAAEAAEAQADAEPRPPRLSRSRSRPEPPKPSPAETAEAAAEDAAEAERRGRADGRRQPSDADRARHPTDPETPHQTRPNRRTTRNQGVTTMAGTLTKDQILDGISELSVLELSELLKEFEERFGVTAAAPVAVAAAAPAGGGARRRRWRRGEDRVRRHPHRRRRQEDPGHQGSPLADQPGPQRGQGPGGRRPQAGPGEGQQGGRREGQGPARGRRRHRRAQVAVAGPRPSGPTGGRAGSRATSGPGVPDQVTDGYP